MAHDPQSLALGLLVGAALVAVIALEIRAIGRIGARERQGRMEHGR